MNDIATVEDRIASKIDTKVAGQLVVSDKAGGMTFTNAGEVMEFAKMLSISQSAVPKHLRGNPGACLGIVMQAIEWRMSPFAVANKSYVVNDRLAYEAQLIHAVAIQRAPIKGRVKFEFSGEGATRKCRAWASIDSNYVDETVEYISPAVGDIKVKNSPLWVSDPDQQLTYYSVRALCRRHFPDVLMGIFAPDEFDAPARARDVTPKPTLTEKLDTIAGRACQYSGPGSEGLDEINVPDVPNPLNAQAQWSAPKIEEVETPGPSRARFPESTEKEMAATARLVTSAEAKAGQGTDEFVKWVYGLSPIDYDTIDSRMDDLRKIAAKADGGKKK